MEAEESPDGDSERPPEAPSGFDEGFFDGMVAAATDAVLTADADGTIVYANPAVEDLLGYDPAEMRGERFVEFVPERLRERYASWFERHVGGESGTPLDDENYEVTLLTADGTETRLSVSGFTHESDGRSLFTGFVREAPDTDASGERLREEEALVAEIFDTSPTALAVRDADGELLRANERAAELVGVGDDKLPYDAEGDAEEWTVYDTEGNRLSKDEYPVSHAFETGDPVCNEEVIVEQPSGKRVHLSVSAAPVREDGDVERVVSAAEDITELKESQYELEQRRDELETELSEVFTRITDAFFALDTDWNVTYVNDEAEQLLLQSEAELVGENVWDVFSEAVGTTFQRQYERAMETQEPVSFVEYYSPLSTWFEVRAYPSETGLSVYFRDVTERKERERELERYETIVETVDDGIYVVGPDGTFSMVNSAFEEITGYEFDELREVSPSIFYDDEIEREVEQRHRELVAGERSAATVEHDLKTADGDTVHVEVTFVVRPTDDGSDADYERIGVLRNVTERKERERELERYETIVETVGDGVYALDSDERFVMVNDAFCEMINYDREEILGEHASVVHSERINEEAAEMTDAVTDEMGSATLELELRTKDGGTVPVETRFGPYRYDDEAFARTGVVRDITERVRFEQTLTALHESSRELLGLETADEVCEAVLQTTTDVLGIRGAGIYLYDDEASELAPCAVSDHVADMFGDLPTFGPGDESITWRAFADGETVTFDDVAETDLTYRDDTPLRSGIWIPLGDHGVLAVVSEEVGAFDADDRELADLLAATTEAALDRVERERERREHERELEAQNERLDAFASMLAHELRNPLEIAQIYLDTGVENALGEDADASAFREVERALDRIEEMIDTLLVVTRRGGSVDTTEPLNLGEAAREWWADLDPDGALSVETDREIRADPSRLRQLLENLFRNAAEHGGPDATVRVGSLPDGFYVEDDGPGIPEDERESVFEPGYSTSNVGVGFGLAVVEQLVDAHDWDCEITEGESGGARFEFTGVETPDE
ncbi:PAS domain S-box protein [Halorussus sp. MSC15.2]|uniref:PAS domain S-box protein n=1 Tax=Halorussus sp. MSC15.2 TaxID=2283638 RepID=UPI0013D53053|nr:PAS domain S-box protein [Halorussus sp. MSC15.2]NEU58886.1 PAS domain S-box protein [Halorussus sp. MSC15.2]